MGEPLHKLKPDKDIDMGKPRKETKKKERWLLTRKTWRYMADAGRRLIPEGVHNRPEDVPKIEKYFQEVCQTEPRFLLWRKASYPGALGFRSHHRRMRTRKKCGSYKEKASSADEAEDLKGNPSGGGLFLTPTAPGRFDLLKTDHLQVEDKLLEQLKILIDLPKGQKVLDHQELFEKLEQYLRDIQTEARNQSRCRVTPEPPQKDLLSTLRRYYSRSPNRESVISNILTDRKLLEKLYFDLRRTRGFRGAGSAYLPEWRSGVEVLEPNPPLVEVVEVKQCTKGIQLPRVNPNMLKVIGDKKKVEEEPKPSLLRRRSSVDHDDVSPSVGDTIKRYLKMARKKSVDADKADRFKTINYDKNLRNIKGKGVPMPGDDDGLHKGCQTDETWQEVLKTMPEIVVWEVGDQPEVTEECTKLYAPSIVCPSPTKGLLSSGQTFLSNLLQGLQLTEKSNTGCSPVAMQKSKSSTSVGRNLVSKKIWRGRSKSQSRVATTQPCSWSPQGDCTWINLTGQHVTLMDTCILHLSEIERRLLQKVALAKLQALNLGCNIIIPSEIATTVAEAKPKRRAHLLKRKAITTGFFDTSRPKEKDGSGSNTSVSTTSGGGTVFGIPLSQCVENERLSRLSAVTSAAGRSTSRDSATFLPIADDNDICRMRRKSHHGSRSSFTSLIDPRALAEESAGSSESLGGSVPGLLDSLSVGSTADVTTRDSEPAVPHIVSSCLRHIENYGLHILGIFRVSSSKKRVRQLREDFDSGKDVALGEDCCPHDVATLLKEFFRDLPEPLLCRDLYRAFLQTQKIRNRRLQYEALQHLIQLLPVPNRDTLWSLLNFLSLVAANSEDHKNEQGETVAGNKMDSNNLATLFAPNILHPSYSSAPAESSDERLDIINVVRSMIDHNKDLFQVSAELLDEVYVHMMDTHPDALDQLLRKRDTSENENAEDPDSGALDQDLPTSEEFSSSVPQTPGSGSDSNLQYESKRSFSRDSFLHANSSTDHLELDRISHRRHLLQGVKKKVREGKKDVEKQSEEDEGNVFEPDSSGVIKASLTLPTSFALNLDDTDIPFIEDASSSLSESSKTSGTIRKHSFSSRQRSTSGSESSQVSIVALQPVTGCLPLLQGYDSAVGSSATYSSPPRNSTTTPSVCSSSDREYPSSPPSWTSSPPLSPDSQKSVVDYIADDVASNTSIMAASKGEWLEQRRTTVTKVTYTHPEEKHIETKSLLKDLYQRIPSLTTPATSSLHPEVMHKSASAGHLREDQESPSSRRKPIASITNIGGAVLRSKTADIERMLRIHKPEAVSKSKKGTSTVTKPAIDEEKKKKRRYTESRHPTRTLTDFPETSSTSSRVAKTAGNVWKRRELISSPLKDHKDDT